MLKEQLEEEQESKLELQRLVSKLNSDVTHWRSRHEADSIQHSDELEETKYVTHDAIHAQFALDWMYCASLKYSDRPVQAQHGLLLVCLQRKCY